MIGNEKTQFNHVLYRRIEIDNKNSLKQSMEYIFFKLMLKKRITVDVVQGFKESK